MEVKKLLDSFNYAIDGIIHALRTQRNMRIHFLATIVVLTACFIFQVSIIEIIALSICIAMVISAELFNTAIESAIDLTANYYHPLAKIAKNTAAGAVLVTAINAILVGYFIFWDKISNITYRVVSDVKAWEPYTVLIMLIMVCILTIAAKAYLGEGTPLKGGMPSGHSAISFAIATAISLISQYHTVIILSYIMAFITAQSRVDSEVHSILEVVVGGVFGVLVTIFIFKIFSF